MTASLGLADQSSQGLGPPVQEPRYRWQGPPYLAGDLRHRQSPQVPQLDGDPLVLGQAGQRLGKSPDLLTIHRPPARRRLVGRQQSLRRADD
jgi:hypothetical protein